MSALQQLLKLESQFNVFPSLCLILIFVLCVNECLKRLNYRSVAQQLPTAYGWPIMGTTHRWLPVSNFFLSFEHYFKKFNSYTYFAWHGSDPFVVTVDPDIVKELLTGEEYLEKSRAMYTPINTAFQNGIISSKVPKWKHNRKLMNAALTHKILSSFIPIFQKCSTNIIEKFEKLSGKGEQNVFSIMKFAALRMAYETTLGVVLQEGVRLNEKLVHDFHYIIEKIADDAMFSIVKLGFLARTPKYHQTIKFLRCYVGKLVANKQNSQEVNNNRPVAEDDNIQKSNEIFLEQAIKLYESGKFQASDIISESHTMIAGSFETVSTTLFSALVLLAMHPDIQERLYEEIYSLLPDKDTAIDADHLKQLSYLNMVIDETLRLTPSIPFIGRQLMKPTKLQNINLPKDMQIVIPIFNLHRREDIWGPDANSFNPDNFLPGNIARRHAYAYIPFSKGVRNCIGWRYAMIALRVMLLDLLRHYKFSTTFKYNDLRFVQHVSIGYYKEPLLAIERRD